MSKVFNVGRFVVQVAWSKSGTWGVTEDSGRLRTYWFSIHGMVDDGRKATHIIIGPFSLMVGYVA